MSKQFEDMQKLAFGKVLINESAQMTKSDLKNKIREMVLDEAKKKKKSKPKNVAPQEDVDIDIAAEPAAEVPTEPSMDIAPAEPTSGGNVIRDIQNLLQDAFEKAQQLPDNEDKEKTINQISNTIKMFVNTQVLGSGQQPVAESLDENVKSVADIDYKMYSDLTYQHWVDDMFDYLDIHKPGFTENDVKELLGYAQDSLSETIETNIQTYFKPETLNESEEYNTGEKYSYRGKMYDIWVDDEHNRYIKIGGRTIDI